MKKPTKHLEVMKYVYQCSREYTHILCLFLILQVQGSVHTSGLAMSSLPCEVIVDTLIPLSRWTLDAVQSTNRRFRRLIDERMSDVCLREIRHAKLDTYNASVEAVAKASIHVNGPPELQFANHKYIVPLKYFTAFVASLRSSRIDTLDVSGKYSNLTA